MVLIAGIDLGTTTAIVIIDEKGNIVKKISKKNFGEKDIIQYLKRFDDLVLIATDKSKIPEKIRKIAARLDIGIFSPKQDLDIVFKKQIYNESEVDDDHERDAAAAAIYALSRTQHVIDKTFKISEDPKERRDILKIFFRNPKLEPTAIKNNLLNNVDHKETIRDRKGVSSKKSSNRKNNHKKRQISNKGEFKDLPRVKKTDTKADNKLKELKKKYIKLMKRYIETKNKLDALSEEIIKGDLLVPKISFLERIKRKSKKVFLDDKRDKYILDKSYKEIYIKDKTYLSKIIPAKNSKVFLCRKYRDLGNFVVPEEIENVEIDANIIDRNIKNEIDEILDLIYKLKYE